MELGPRIEEFKEEMLTVFRLQGFIRSQARALFSLGEMKTKKSAVKRQYQEILK